MGANATRRVDATRSTATDRRRSLLISCCAAALVLGGVAVQGGDKADPMGTGFTYQGRLQDDAAPAEGTYDMELTLYDSSDIGTGTLVATDTVLGVVVSEGLFTVQVDFGSVFTGDALWLRVGVKPAGSPDPYTYLEPLQPVHGTPYALFALTGNEGPPGPEGPEGPEGPQGPPGEDGLSCTMFLTPDLAAPADGALVGIVQYLRWAGAALPFLVEADLVDTFTDPWTAQTYDNFVQLGELRRAGQSLAAGETYFWRVTALGYGGSWTSPTSTFELDLQGTLENPAVSCLAILESGSSTGDGIYWLDTDGLGGHDPLQAYCDMVTDGGGWTFFAHHDANSAPGDLFVSDVGTYQADRSDTGTVYGIAGSVNAGLSHTEMMLTLDDPDPGTAAGNNKILFFRYTVGHSGFTTGPIPCSGLTGYEYRTGIVGAYTGGGTTNLCSAEQWYARTAGDSEYLTNFQALGEGQYWGSGMGGDNSWRHDGYWYVR